MSITPIPVLQHLESMLGNGVAPVNLPADTYSLSTEAVHPDVVCPPNGWMGQRCWVIYTPYKNGDAHYENPAVLFASSDTAWSTPPQLKNPLIPNPGGTSYNSDPDHVYDPVTRRLVQIYRVVDDSLNRIMIMSTTDAKTWSKPVLAFAEPNHNAVSPTMVLESDGTMKVWYVSAGAAGCRSPASTVMLRTAQPDGFHRYETGLWSAATPVSLTIPGYVPWHLDVMEIGPAGGYLAFIAAYPSWSTCSNSDLWLAWSSDGITWTVPAVPILWRNMKAAKSRALLTWYRGTMRYDVLTDSLDLWPSALTSAGWGIYHTSVKLGDLLPVLRAAQPGDYISSMMAATNTARTVVMP